MKKIKPTALNVLLATIQVVEIAMLALILMNVHYVKIIMHIARAALKELTLVQDHVLPVQ